MKRFFATLLTSVMLLSMLGGCQNNNSTATPTPDPNNNQGTATNAPTTAPTAQTKVENDVTLTVLGMSSQEADINLVRDLLSKSGFKVTVNMQPDYASSTAQQEAGNYDLQVSGWTTVTGNPDYAVRSLFKTGGDYNRTNIADPKVDELIDLAASQTPSEFVATYKELELELVERNAYIIPLYSSLKTQAFNHTILEADTVRLSKSRSMVWEAIDYVDQSKRDTEPLYLSQTLSTLTSLDPIKGNDGSINMLNTNQYIRIVNLTDDDEVVSEGSLSYQYAIAEGNSEYYFVLRDDVNFAEVKDRKAVDSGVRVGGEDVVFSLSRARDRNSVPNHLTYSLHESMESIELVTDIDVLDEIKDSDTGKSIREILEAMTPSAIEELTDDKTKVDNAGGIYQVVKVTTVIPFPQVLNYLAHQSAGIVCEERVTEINSQYDIATYDRTKDIAYGDQSVITEGANYDNHLMTSGPYIAIYKNDYEVVFEKNPGYMTNNEEHAPRIKTYHVKFISDNDAALSALRSGEIYVLYSVPNSKYDLVRNDSDLTLQEIPSNGVTYLTTNREGVLADENLRKAVLYSINQDDIMAFYDDNYFKAYTTLSPLVETGNVLVADPAKVNEFLSNYYNK